MKATERSKTSQLMRLVAVIVSLAATLGAIAIILLKFTLASG